MRVIKLLTPEDQQKCEELIARLRQEYEKKPWKEEDARDFFSFMADYLERAHGRIGEQEFRIKELEALNKAVGAARDYVLEHMGSRAQFDRIVYTLQTQNSDLIKRLNGLENKVGDLEGRADFHDEREARHTEEIEELYDVLAAAHKRAKERKSNE